MGIFIRMLDHSLNVLTAASCVFRPATMDATKVASSAYHLLDSVSWLKVRVYPLLRDLSQRIRGSNIQKSSSGDRGSPWSVTLRTLIFRVYQCRV